MAFLEAQPEFCTCSISNHIRYLEDPPYCPKIACVMRIAEVNCLFRAVLRTHRSCPVLAVVC